MILVNTLVKKINMAIVKAISKAKKEGLKYKLKVFKNGETPKQLLARCRYILAKKETKWTNNQQIKADILFKEYPKLKIAYDHIMEFRNIYEGKEKDVARVKIENWIEKTQNIKIKEFNTVSNTIKYNLDNILNFFVNRNTNANAESFNSKIKLFRANLRGVSDTKFFLFRLHKLFA